MRELRKMRVLWADKVRLSSFDVPDVLDLIDRCEAAEASKAMLLEALEGAGEFAEHHYTCKYDEAGCTCGLAEFEIKARAAIAAARGKP